MKSRSNPNFEEMNEIFRSGMRNLLYSPILDFPQKFEDGSAYSVYAKRLDERKVMLLAISLIREEVIYVDISLNSVKFPKDLEDTDIETNVSIANESNRNFGGIYPIFSSHTQYKIRQRSMFGISKTQYQWDFNSKSVEDFSNEALDVIRCGEKKGIRHIRKILGFEFSVEMVPSRKNLLDPIPWYWSWAVPKKIRDARRNEE